MLNDSHNLYSVVIELVSAQKGLPTKTLGRALHSQVLRWMAGKDEVLTEQLHQNQTSPLSISPIHRKRGKNLTVEGEQFFFRVGLLQGHFIQPLLKGLEQEENKPIILDRFSFRLCYVHVLPGNHPLAETTSYFLLSKAHPTSTIHLRFRSPTSFKTDDYIQPFPLPELVFGSLLRRWNTFAPTELHLPEIQWQGRVAAFELKTYALKLKSPEIGSQGWVKYIFPDTEQAQIASILAQFAFFSGVGRKTTMGMGQVEEQSERIILGTMIDQSKREQDYEQNR